MGPSAHHRVNRLATIAFQSVFKESFRRSGALDSLVDFLHAKYNSSAFYSSPRQALCQANNALLQKVLELELPRTLVIELGNCMVEYQNSMLHFAHLLCSLLECDKTRHRDNIKTLCQCIAVSPNGIIDKQRSIINAVATQSLSGYSSALFIGFFCVSPAKITQEYQRRMAEGKHCPQICMYKNVDPLQVWQKKQNRERMEGHFYECLAIWGHWEALEYFFKEMEPSILQKEISKAASCIQHHEISVENILFFRKQMDRPTWLTFLKRCFHRIFKTFLKNFRYKQMCVVLYSEVCEVLDDQVIYSCINALNDHVLDLSESPQKMELMLADLEPLFVSLWELTTAANKNKIDNTFFKMYKTLLRYRKYKAVTALIKDEALTKRRWNQFAGCAVIAMIMDNDDDSLVEFLRQISPEKRVSVKDDLLAPANLSTYIAFIDCLCDVTKYDRLLKAKYPEQTIRVAKRSLLLNGHHIILQALREGFVGASQYEAFLYWVFDNNGVQVDQYVKTCNQPPNLLAEVYKNYITSSRQGISTIAAFRQCDEVMQKIRIEIAKDQTSLFEHCFKLMLSKDYAALPRMLNSVFAQEHEQELFLKAFLLSRYGLESICSMFYSPAYDSDNFCQFFLKNKMKEFLDFKKHWILNPRIGEVLEYVMDGLGRAQVISDLSNEGEPVEELKLDMLPHETPEGFSRVYQGNIAIFKSLARNSILGDMFCSVANAL